MTKDGRTYIRLHDGMPDHPKIEGLSDAAFRLLITMWCRCNATLSDGKVTTKWWRQQRLRARRELLDAGLVRQLDGDAGGVVAHDYLKHQWSRDEVAEMREKRRISGRQGGLARANGQASARATATANGTAGGQANGKQVVEQLASKRSSKTQASVSISKQEEEQELKDLPAARRTRAAREGDELFDAIAVACGVQAPYTRTAGSQIAGVVKQLQAVQASAAAIAIKAAAYRSRYPNSTLTPTALAKHWSALPDGPVLSRAALGLDWEDN